jgi:DNA-binding NarL/FixJ family response regulator
VSSTTIATRTPPAANAAQGLVAVIAADGSSERIAESLCGQALEMIAFDSVEELVGRAEQQSFSAIVHWVQDTISTPARLIEPLAQHFAQAPIVVVCTDIERWEMRALLAAGAAGVVLSGDLDAALPPSLEAVLAGQTCVPRGHWRQIEPLALSSRERQILGLVVMGYTNGQIAAQLFLAESTVKSHLSSAFGKLGVRSRNEAVSLILDPERGLGMGILALGGEPVEQTPATAW